MLEGRIDEAVKMNTGAISSTSDTAGSPFSFQNVAITVAIERYLRGSRRRDRVGAVDPCVVAQGSGRTGTRASRSVSQRQVTWRLLRSCSTCSPRTISTVCRATSTGWSPSTCSDWWRSASTTPGEAGPFSRYWPGSPLGDPWKRLRVLRPGRAHLRTARGDDGESRGRRPFAAMLESREPGPWTSLCRLDRSRLLAHCEVGARPHGAELGPPRASCAPWECSPGPRRRVGTETRWFPSPPPNPSRRPDREQVSFRPPGVGGCPGWVP